MGKSSVSVMTEKGVWRQESHNEDNLPIAATFACTPEMAADFLKNHAQLNRRVDRRRVMRYKLAMLAGNWRASNDDICFDKDGKMQNGYHRITAISELKRPIRVSFKFGMPPEAVESMDEGRPRSLANVATMMNDDPNSVGLRGAAFLLEASGDKWLMGREIQRAFYLKYQEVFDKVAGRLNKDTARGPIVAAIARAVIHHQSKGGLGNDNAFVERIYEFATAISVLEFRGEGGNAPLRLRDFVVRHGRGRQNGSQRMDLYLKTIASIKNFLDQRSVERLSAAADGIWPIPEEKDGISIAESMYEQLGGKIEDYGSIKDQPKKQRRRRGADDQAQAA